MMNCNQKAKTKTRRIKNAWCEFECMAISPFKDKKFAVGESLYEPLQPEDDLGLTVDELNDLSKNPMLI